MTTMTALRSIPALLWLALLMAGSLVNVLFHTRFNISCSSVLDESVSSFVAPSQKSQDDDVQSIIEELYDALSDERLSKIVSKYKEEYSHASPFPHIAIDDIFPKRLLQKVIQENPESRLEDNGCVKDAQHCFVKSKKEFQKSAITDENYMGFYTRVLFGALKSSTFIKFLERLTRINYLVPDPHYYGSGLHFTASGGNLDIHADFNKLSNYKLDRRVNAFIYLNPDWPEDHGGHLELWSKDMKTCHQRILPTMGRFVVFSTTDFSYHGHPQPLSAPVGRARRSIALYYYTNGRPAEECRDGDCKRMGGHSTLFQTPVGCEVCQEDTCKAFEGDGYNVPSWVDNDFTNNATSQRR